jgi:hypothetical protein
VADINLESQSPVAIDPTDAAIVRRGSGPYTAELVTLGNAATLAVGTSAGTVAAGDHTHADAVAAGAAGFMTGADKTKLDGIAAGAQVNVATDLAYTAATRLLASSTGADVTLPIVTSTDAGLAPLSGGGTSNFLRADGTWAAPGGGATNLAWNAATSTVTSDTGTDATLTLADGTNPGLAPIRSGVSTQYLSGTGVYSVPAGATNLTYTAATRVVASDTGTDATLPLVTTGDAGLAPASGGGTANFLRADATWTAPVGTTNLTYTAATRVLASDTGTDATLPLVTTGDAGLAPASGGGTTNFLRADGTWAAPGGGSITVQDEGINITTALSTLNFVGAGVTVTGGATATVTIPSGGGGLSDGNYGDVTVSGTGTVITLNPKIKHGLPRAMGRRLFF